MHLSRFTALETIIRRTEEAIEFTDTPTSNIASYFGCNVFGNEAMTKYLSEETHEKLKDAIRAGKKLSRNLADDIALGMQKWAMDKGATHYAHWFQPLTGRTAEKHDSFFTIEPDGTVLEEFSGDALAQQEPDGSSFPGGGLRSTFEARGYTAWDPSSPAFILEVGEGKTLCIPTIFVTYGGEALDYKLPLLKSEDYLSRAALQVCRLFESNAEVNRVNVTLGWEQEYFLIDEAFYYARPDLMLTGRTLIGKNSPKGQQLEDHYFGLIPKRIYSFMRDLEMECHKLGIPVRTRHNEVGPGQYEIAPMYEEVNIAVDHNQLLMDLMDRVAVRHRFRVLLHEKPFEGVNGSGKHNNWSLATNTGKNLLKPGSQPGRSLEFLSFFVATIRAVHEYADILRASVASASNDHRLGANEAPPAIVSVFIGDFLTKVLNDIAQEKLSDKKGVKEIMELLAKIPELERDNTDRNRTSPFAFTGNKFEIRMVGSIQNCAATMTVMNTIVGYQLVDFYGKVQERMEEGAPRDTAILKVIKEYILEARPVLFEGDGYSEEWKEEAARRGLPHLPNTPEALQAYNTEKSISLFTETGVLTARELEAHYEVRVKNYILHMQIESRTLGEIAINHIMPAALRYQSEIAENIENLRKAGVEDVFVQKELLRDLSENIKQIYQKIHEMTRRRRAANTLSDIEQIARRYCDEIKPLMEEIRLYTDRLEYLVADPYWPMVKYRELMFMK